MQTYKISLQEILFNGEVEDDAIHDMYYRSKEMDRLVKGEEGEYVAFKNTYLDFSTYLNSLSLEKWKKYTKATKYGLELVLCGRVKVEVFGHYINSKNVIQKEWLGRYYFDLEEKDIVDIPIPVESTSSMVVAFQITALKKTKLYSGRYYTILEPEEVSRPKICMATTTFKKEDYIKRNASILNRTLFNPNVRDEFDFKWIIVDNASTINPADIENDSISVIKNRNVGGAGGFTKGMLTAINSSYKFTHVLLMDDDVFFLPEAFKRLYRLLSILKPEYENCFVSGAMLENTERNIQHEDVGFMSSLGEHGPIKPRYDLNRWDSVILNEKIIDSDEKLYAGWWFCCIPMSVAREDNLPLPFFIRGDDVEYSLRNNAKFITMNGICIWHEGFATKFSGALELYQVHRNDLILTAIHDNLSDLKVMQRITWLFWEELYKFNYKGANLLVDAIEDYLKGPEYLKSLDGEICMKEHKNADNVLLPLTNEILGKYGQQIADLYNSRPMKKSQAFIYNHTCNGQRIPSVFAKNKCGIIPYGWGYYRDKMYLVKSNLAIDPINNMYVEYNRDDREYKKTRNRFLDIQKKYLRDNSVVKDAYKKAFGEITSEEFWNQYLN